MSAARRSMPRGIKNHNPLNIRINPANNWQGRVDPAKNTDGDFEQFTDPVWGIRAGARNIIFHYDRNGADTVRKLVALWAPPSENDTEAYIRFVCGQSGFQSSRKLDFHRFEYLKPVLVAMIRIENGLQPYTETQIDAGLVRAGVLPPEQPLGKTRTVKGGQVAATGTVGAATVEAVRESLTPAQETLFQIAPYLEIAKWALLALTLVGLGVMLWARIDDRRKGLR
jgi:hypothetical protein